MARWVKQHDIILAYTVLWLVVLIILAIFCPTIVIS